MASKLPTISAEAFEEAVRTLRLQDTCNVDGCKSKTYALISLPSYGWTARICKRHYTGRSKLRLHTRLIYGK